MYTLIEQLTAATQDLKSAFIEKTKEYANDYYALCQERRYWKEVDWCSYFGVEPRPVNAGTSMEFLSFPKHFSYTADGKRYKRMLDDTFRTTGKTLEQYIIKEIDYAEKHYVSSIQKLGKRLNAKGIVDDDIFEITSGKVGMNFECTIKHNYVDTIPTKTTKAWTIIASGPVQQPHYRYLVK